MSDMNYEHKLKLIRLFNEIGLPIEITQFNGRLLFQKTVYLLQEMGLHFGYSYGWYIRGPYSPAVADTGFDIQLIQNHHDVAIPILTNMENLVTENFRRMLHEARTIARDLSDYELLELLASLHFIINYSYPRPQSHHEAIARLTRIKPNFSDYADRILPIIITHFPIR